MSAEHLESSSRACYNIYAVIVFGGGRRVESGGYLGGIAPLSLMIQGINAVPDSLYTGDAFHPAVFV